MPPSRSRPPLSPRRRHHVLGTTTPPSPSTAGPELADSAANGGFYRQRRQERQGDLEIARHHLDHMVSRTEVRAGQASVVIDGVNKGTVDLYSASAAPISTVFSGLSNATHTVVIKVLHTKNADPPASRCGSMPSSSVRPPPRSRIRRSNMTPGSQRVGEGHRRDLPLCHGCHRDGHRGLHRDGDRLAHRQGPGLRRSHDHDRWRQRGHESTCIRPPLLGRCRSPSPAYLRDLTPW